jgi:DNA-binding transcriptional MerR regulator
MYSIGQLAKSAQVSNRTLRYYEELGLISPNSRGENRYRYYDNTHLQRLNTIKMLQESGFALKEIVAALQPQLDPKGNITYMGQEMAKKIFKALDEQRTKLIARHNELALAVEEIQRTMKSLTDCFGCKIAGSLEDCARCENGAGEIVHLGKHLTDIKADYRKQQNTSKSGEDVGNGPMENVQSKALNDKNSSRV